MAIIPTEQTDLLSSSLEEIKDLVLSGKTDRSISRLLDFARCFTTGFEFENNAILLSAEFHQHASEVRMHGETGETRRATSIINKRVLELSDDIYTEYTSTPETPLPISQPTKHEPENDNNGSETAQPQSQPENNITKLPRRTNTETHTTNYISNNFIEAKTRFRNRKETPPTNISDNSGITFHCKDLGKTYRKGSFHLSNINLDLRPGEITGLVGENGNGKTTLLRIIAGEISSSEGFLNYPSLNNGDMKWDYIKKQIAYVEQLPSKWYGTLSDNLHYTASSHGLKGKENRHEIEFILHRLGLEQYRNHTWSEISGGYKMRFELARALVSQPRLLILDEPLAPLDIKAQRRFLLDLRDLASYRKNPLPIIVSSQHLYEIEEIADKILFLKAGQPKFYGNHNDLKEKIKDNLYELNCKIPRPQLQQLLEPLNCINITSSGTRYNILTPQEISSHDVLSAITQKGIEITYFRDISISTRRLFDETF